MNRHKELRRKRKSCSASYHTQDKFKHLLTRYLRAVHTRRSTSTR